ncbi:enoyl-CoA hydratase/isomerase family protein [Novosphingobium sp. 2580]|uniref:Enoyl-CoA hydratase/isomerase family protein n=2 Tax=Novosphingobium album (ex Hu et al. 2023) TaxID=2930093 RepID=A0ABT0AZ43_9SPHN|nr:enoyl-CoA hydratase/isomerase family protein [Novosphingobium album (ex Hu et al. 2023)]
MNLLDEAMFADLERLVEWLEAAEEVKVAVFESADDHFFIAHADLGMLSRMPMPAPQDVTGPSPHQQVFARFQRLPQLTIGKLRGIARGGGSEFLLALDLRYGARETAVLGQPELPLGFPPGCGATQRLPRLVGRSHAIEAIMSGRDYNADEAERIGWLTRSMPDADLDAFVEDLAGRVASFPKVAIVQAKRAIDASLAPADAGSAAEFFGFLTAFGQPEAKTRVQKAMANGFQTRSVERTCLDDWVSCIAP